MYKTISKKSFTDYYYGDPVFRERHLARLKEKVACECGFTTARSNMTRHKRSRNHENRMIKKEDPRNLDLKALKKMEEQLNQTIRMIEEYNLESSKGSKHRSKE